MFDLINGIPVHPLVVHAVVVLLPLGIVGTVAIVARPAWRSRYGTLVLALTAAAAALIPIATSSGESLEHRVGDPGQHARLGDQLIWYAVPLLVFQAAFVYLGRRHESAGSSTRAGKGAGVLRVVAVLATVAAIAAGVQVYRVGDSGARAAWGDKVSSAQSAR